MPTSANWPKNPSDARADEGIRAPILPLSQRPFARAPRLTSQAGEGAQRAEEGEIQRLKARTECWAISHPRP